jgi:ankyrin repeat protein
VVPEKAAKPDGCDSISLRVNHLDLTRPDSEDDYRFTLVLDGIKHLLNAGAGLSQTELNRPDPEGYAVAAGLGPKDGEVPNVGSNPDSLYTQTDKYGERLHTLIEKEPSVDTQDTKLETPLETAAFNGHMVVLQVLIERGADINNQSEKYGGALQAAALAGHEQVIRLLLDRGANINAQGGEFGSALQAASANGHSKVVQLLLESGAEVNARSGEFGSALQAAAFAGHTEILRLLLQHGADVNALGGKFGNALQAAAFLGHTEILHLLLERRANVNAVGGKFGIALNAAAAGGHTEIIHLLLEKGANMNPIREISRPISRTLPSVFTVPFNRDATFVGRGRVIRELNEHFKNPCRVSLTGLGGVGYTYCLFI